MAAIISAAVGLGAYAMGASALTALAVGVGTAGLMANQQQRKANDLQQQAMNQAQQAAEKQSAQQDQAFNKANQKTPDVASILSGAQQSAKAGGGGTMLTGPQGIDPSALALQKNTLLGS
jgi:FKBP-type peptidyl-prolyl cis-trans isomerase